MKRFSVIVIRFLALAATFLLAVTAGFYGVIVCVSHLPPSANEPWVRAEQEYKSIKKGYEGYVAPSLIVSREKRFTDIICLPSESLWERRDILKVPGETYDIEGYLNWETKQVLGFPVPKTADVALLIEAGSAVLVTCSPLTGYPVVHDIFRYVAPL